MRLINVPLLITAILFPVSAQWGAKLNTGDVLNSNASGAQGDYHVEFWKKQSSDAGTMTLGEGGNFSCSWNYCENILCRKGVRPGTRDEVITFDADYNPQGNSYLSVYGWFDDNPLVEYYIIESYGTWNPASDGSRTKHGSFESDGGTYDIFENSMNAANIHGSGPFTQYWSIRKTKRTSGVITCANHFAAWDKAGMKVGKFYEVSFNVEAYKSGGGSADVKVNIGKAAVGLGNGTVISLPAVMPANVLAPLTFYNALGQRISGISGSVPVRGHSVQINASNRASGVYFTIPDAGAARFSRE